MPRGTLLFCSALALDPPFLRVAEILARDYELEGHVLAPVSRDQFSQHDTDLNVHFLPPAFGNVDRYGFERRSLRTLLNAISPTHVWIHAEFWQGISHQFLKTYRFTRSPHIVSYVAVNHIAARTRLFRSTVPFVRRSRLTQRLLWPRLDGVSACASISSDCARRIGLPVKVPVSVNYLPALGPEASSTPLDLPWIDRDAFIVGFAGLINEQKGWNVLLDAVERLPDRFKAVIVGVGDQVGALAERASRPQLAGRVFCPGAVDRPRLLATYPRFDAFVLPSITLPDSVEQFGMVLAEAMAAGVPVIGSDSGAIPETIGDAGIVVPEHNAEMLAAAIVRLSADESQREHFRVAGRARHRRFFSCEAYARSLARLLGLNRAN